MRSNRLVGLQAAPLLRALSALLRTSSRVLQRHADVVLSAHCRERRSCGELGSCSSRSGLSFRSQTSRGARCRGASSISLADRVPGLASASETRARAAPAARETSTTSVRAALFAAPRALLPFLGLRSIPAGRRVCFKACPKREIVRKLGKRAERTFAARGRGEGYAFVAQKCKASTMTAIATSVA